MAEKITVELDESFLKKFFGLTDQLVPSLNEIDLAVLKRQVMDIEEQMLNSVAGVSSGSESKKSSSGSKNKIKDLVEARQNQSSDENVKGHILIIDDLGVITYQLSNMFRRAGFDCVTSNEIVSAIDLFKKNHYDFVLMDLFIPTQREGFILLEELKKISANKPHKTTIGVISASNKKEYKISCAQKGSDFYMEKTDSWQTDLCKIIENYE